MRVSESEQTGRLPTPETSGVRRLQGHAHVISDIASVYGVQLANYAAPLITVPYLTRVLGPASWGLVAMAQAFALYGNLLVEYGFIYSGTRQIATASRDREVEDVISGVSAAKMLLSALVIVAAAIAYLFVPLFHAHPLLLWMAVSAEILKASLPNYYFYGVKRIKIASLLDISARTAAAAGVFILVRGPSDAWKVFALQGVGATLAFIVGHAMIYSRYALRLPRVSAGWAMLRQGSAMFLFRSVYNSYALGNAFLLGLFATPQVVGFYSGAEKINSAAAGLLSPLSTALYPRAAELAKTSLPKAAMLTKWSLYVMLCVSVLLGVVMWFGASTLVRMLLGQKFVVSASALRILSFRAPMIALTNVLGFQWLLALGMERSFQRITVVALVVNVVLAACLAPLYGFNGMACCVVTSQAVAAAGIFIVLARRNLNPISLAPDSSYG